MSFALKRAILRLQNSSYLAPDRWAKRGSRKRLKILSFFFILLASLAGTLILVLRVSIHMSHKKFNQLRKKRATNFGKLWEKFLRKRINHRKFALQRSGEIHTFDLKWDICFHVSKKKIGMANCLSFATWLVPM